MVHGTQDCMPTVLTITYTMPAVKEGVSSGRVPLLPLAIPAGKQGNCNIEWCLDIDCHSLPSFKPGREVFQY